MPYVSCYRGELQISRSGASDRETAKLFRTGLEAIDTLLPHNGLHCGAIHELLFESGQNPPLFFAAFLAAAAIRTEDPDSPDWAGMVAWSDPHRCLYPPAVQALGIPLDRLLLLHPQNSAEEVWVVAECLRCAGIRATVSQFGSLSRIEARRLQLAAEVGGGIGVFLRSYGPAGGQYAARTRWLVRSIPGLRTVQRWQLQLIHGHGGQVGQSAILEVCRETNHVRAFALLADRPTEIHAERRSA